MQHCVCAVASGTRCWGKKSAQERRAPVAPCALGRLVPVFASPRQGSEARAERMVEEVHTATACVALRCSALLCASALIRPRCIVKDLGAISCRDRSTSLCERWLSEHVGIIVAQTPHEPRPKTPQSVLGLRHCPVPSVPYHQLHHVLSAVNTGLRRLHRRTRSAPAPILLHCKLSLSVKPHLPPLQPSSHSLSVPTRLRHG
jgi:hypothetical protein